MVELPTELTQEHEALLFDVMRGRAEDHWVSYRGIRGFLTMFTVSEDPETPNRLTWIMCLHDPAKKEGERNTQISGWCSGRCPVYQPPPPPPTRFERDDVV